MSATQSSSPEEMTLRAQIADAQRGDPKAFQFLYERYRSYVASHCRRFGCDHALTEDLTQDVFIRIWKQIAGFKGRSAFSTWLYRITRNVIFAHFRRKKRSTPSVSDVLFSSAETVDLGEKLCTTPSAVDSHLMLVQIMAGLSARDRSVLELYLAGFKHHEIANILRISRATSRSQLHRLRLKIKASYGLAHEINTTAA